MIRLLQATAVPDSLGVSPIAAMTEDLKNGSIDWANVLQQLMNWALDAGRHILVAAVVYFVGRYAIKFLNFLVNQMLERRKVETSVTTFLKSFVNILLQVLLIISVLGALGVNTTSFAALLASFGVAIGMALSGNLQNFAGGIVILFLKPYKVGDWIETQGTAGTVIAIQIFHTILLTADGKQIYVPNGALSSGSITNYSQTPTRRLDWDVAVEYDEDMDRVRRVAEELMKSDKRILPIPEPAVYLKELADSSVNVLLRAWVNNDDYWAVLFDMNERIYKTFNAEGISFPFPQITVHQG
ncbi:MAG: mechanosensitive ion channel [Bacteroidaceae bacterium]|nr:mechanosensitive ion channel [Bacteroidaceae bacterium]